MTFFSSLAQIIQVSSSCPSTFTDSILCAWQYARSWLGIQCQAKHGFLYSGPTSSAPTYYANSFSGFIILLVFIFCTLIFSYSTTNSKQILLICHPCQVIPSSTILRPRQKESLPWALHFREPTLAPTLARYFFLKWEVCRVQGMLSDSSALYHSRFPRSQIYIQSPEVSSPGQTGMQANPPLGPRGSQEIACKGWGKVAWEMGHAMAKNLGYGQKEVDYRRRTRWQKANSPLATIF